jgi:hypothetical protein
MTDANKPLVVQITRGLAPAASIAHVVAACAQRGLAYELLSGRPAAVAKQEAAQMAVDRECDLLLAEDDILADGVLWERMLAADGADVRVASAVMGNGEINCWYVGQRLAYSGTVFLRASLSALRAIGSPWFQPRELAFTGADGGRWQDLGPNAEGKHSDIWFFFRCWECGLRPQVVGQVTHIVQQDLYYAAGKLSQPSNLKALGLVSGGRVRSLN